MNADHSGPSGPPNHHTVLEVRAIGKRLGDAFSLNDISFKATGGEILAIVGGNGAGKTTVARILAGQVTPDSGTISLDGLPMRFESPREAIASNVYLVSQASLVCPSLSVWENIALGQESSYSLLGLRILNSRRTRSWVYSATQKYGFLFRNLDQPAGVLSGGEQRALALFRAVLRAPEVLILDEPDAALGVQERRFLRVALDEAKSRGSAVILISHNIDDVTEVSDRYLLLKHGTIVDEGRIEPTEKDAVMRRLVSLLSIRDKQPV